MSLPGRNISKRLDVAGYRGGDGTGAYEREEEESVLFTQTNNVSTRPAHSYYEADPAATSQKPFSPSL